jgi:nitrite reductase/ring-hydroxylating ferredoxin subunit
MKFMKKIITIKIEELDLKKSIIKSSGNKKIGIFYFGEQEYKVYEMTCPHMGGDLCSGKINNNTIQCGWHGYLFSLISGKFIKNPNLENTKSVRIKSLYYDPQNCNIESLILKNIDYKIIDKEIIIEI